MVEYVDATYGKGLLVILGAGASYDAVSSMDVQFRPPLTNGLVSDSTMTKSILQRYPAATAVYDFLDRVTKGSPWGDKAQSLEEALRNYQSLSYSNPMVTAHISAFRFYLRDLLFKSVENVVGERSGVTNYVTLARQCIQWARETKRPVCFVNFNYDPLLELALKQVDDFDPLQLQDYVKGPEYYLLKPHGSILWNWPDTAQEFANDEMALKYAIEEGNPESLVDSEIVLSNAPTYLVQSSVTGRLHSCIPAIALPSDRGKVFVWPTEQNALFSDPAGLVSDKTFSNGVFGRVITIGWRGAETHFLPLLRRLVVSNAELWTVTHGNSSHDEIMKALQNVLPNAGFRYYENGFGGFLDDMALSQALDW